VHDVGLGRRWQDAASEFRRERHTLIAFKSLSSADSNHQFRITYFSTFNDKVDRLAICQFGLAQGLAPDGIKPRENPGQAPRLTEDYETDTPQWADKNPEKVSCMLLLRHFAKCEECERYESIEAARLQVDCSYLGVE
jgi:hypothetical protein